ncbi:alpha/beta fold hydrolase [Roseateles sp.]|uniref:alpha/beta fold hydrolase n=1 Tax=Roseateles sp. TaxID=1971397 RepID=UPI0039E74C5C
MPWINVGHERAGSVNLHCEDEGTGASVVLIHGWPLASSTWDAQRTALLEAGLRVTTYDRRSCGLSAPATNGHDFDTYAEDLHRVLCQLDLKDVTLVGHGMGAGEIVRYLGSYGDDRVARCVLLAPISPTPTASTVCEGVSPQVQMDRWLACLRRDRKSFLKRFMEVALGEAKFLEVQTAEACQLQAIADTEQNSTEVLKVSASDFRDDLHRIAVPTLVVQGDQDALYPLETAGVQLERSIANANLVRLPGAPHALPLTHARDVNDLLLSFIGGCTLSAN